MSDFRELDALIKAGYGDCNQSEIPANWREIAAKGEAPMQRWSEAARSAAATAAATGKMFAGFKQADMQRFYRDQTYEQMRVDNACSTHADGLDFERFA